MIASMQEAVAAIRKLSPHPASYSKGCWSTAKSKIEFPIFYEELTDDMIADHLCGKMMLGAVGSDPEHSTNCVGLDLDAHLAQQKPADCAKKIISTAQALDVPLVVHTSKSGKGAHIRTLFKTHVPTNLARALYAALLLAAGISADRSVDKIWPPADGYGVLLFPYNAKTAIKTGGGLALDPNTLRPFPKYSQIDAVLDAPEMDKESLDGALKVFGITTEEQARILSGGKPCSANNCPVKDSEDPGLKHMLDHCKAVARLQNEADSVSYEFWFAMMTNFKPFEGGREIFEAMSELDPKRYKPRALETSWRAIRGKPKLCENLDHAWECPHKGLCPAKAPAGLPFALKKLGRV